jgi:hypothetical protein
MKKLILFSLVLCITSLNLMALEITVEDAEGLIHDDVRLNNDNQTSFIKRFSFSSGQIGSIWKQNINFSKTLNSQTFNFTATLEATANSSEWTNMHHVNFTSDKNISNITTNSATIKDSSGAISCQIKLTSSQDGRYGSIITLETQSANCSQETTSSSQKRVIPWGTI